jgi:hypothetical protein
VALWRIHQSTCLALALLCVVPQSASGQLSPEAEERLKALDREIRGLMNDVSESSDQIPSSIVWLDCATHKPSALLFPPETRLTAACADLQRQPAGYVVRLTFENPHRARVQDGAVRLWFGSTALEAVTGQQRVDAALPPAVAAGEPASTTITIGMTPTGIGAIGVEAIPSTPAGPR